MKLQSLYYYIKPCLPRNLQLLIRRNMALLKRSRNRHVWPIDERAGLPPARWAGWPEGKQFALVLTHDVDTAKGQENCCRLVDLEQQHGFRSSFYFVAERYRVLPELRSHLHSSGFEVGLHGLTHDVSMFESRKSFLAQVSRINRYLAEWQSVGFRSPCMYHNLDWMHELDIEYDASTFDTDPFEPQPDGMGTIYPFMVDGRTAGTGYVELPYTLPQDFTLFSLLKEGTIDIWKRKLDWIAQNGGMALLNTHPDYMNFNGCKGSSEQYTVRLYESLLNYIRDQYEGRYWHPLPKDMARFWRKSHSNCATPT